MRDNKIVLGASPRLFAVLLGGATAILPVSRATSSMSVGGLGALRDGAGGGARRSPR